MARSIAHMTSLEVGEIFSESNVEKATLALRRKPTQHELVLCWSGELKATAPAPGQREEVIQ